MTEDLRDLLARTAGEDARAARAEDFHGTFGDAVRARVRRRRAARAVGAGSVAALSVGVVAFGAVRLPGMTSAPLGAADCLPGAVATAAPAEPQVKPTAHAIDVSGDRDRETWLLYDDVDQEVALEVAVVREGVIEVTEPGGQTDQVLPNELGQFVFEAPSGGWVTFRPGAMPALDWSSQPPVTVHFDGATYTVASASGASARLFVEDGELNAKQPGGHAGLRPHDGRYTVELSDGAVVHVILDEQSGELRAWASSDVSDGDEGEQTEVEPSVVCVTPEPTPSPSASSSPAPSPTVAPSEGPVREPSPAPSASTGDDGVTASSPYQCGFEFPEDARLPEEWAITASAWNPPGEAWEEIEAQFAEPIDGFLVEPTEAVLTIWADGTFGRPTGVGVYAGEVGFRDPADPRTSGVYQGHGVEGMGYVATSVAVVAVADGVVVGTLDYSSTTGAPGYTHAELHDDPKGAMRLYVLDSAAIVGCDGVDEAGDQLFAVSGAVARMSDGTLTGPFYGWHEIENP